MISLIRRFSAIGPTAKTASFNALQAPPLSARALTCTLLSNVTGPVYLMAVGEIPPLCGGCPLPRLQRDLDDEV